MAIDILEKFEVNAPIDEVWRFVVEPSRVVTCMPGAELLEQIDEATYLGKVKVKLGAITTAYTGEVVFTDVDDGARTIKLTGQGKETGGGTATGTVDIALASAEGGQVEMTVQANVDVTGKVAQVGRGMIKGVSKQLFKQFANNARSQLESASGEGGAAVPAMQGGDALAVAPLLGKTLWASIVNFFRRLFGLAER